MRNSCSIRRIFRHRYYSLQQSQAVARGLAAAVFAFVFCLSVQVGVMPPWGPAESGGHTCYYGCAASGSQWQRAAGARDSGVGGCRSGHATGIGPRLTATVRVHLVLSLTGVCRELVREGSHTCLATLRLPLRVGLLDTVAASLGVAVAGGRVPEGPPTVRRAVVALGSCRSPPLESYFRPSCPIPPVSHVV